MLAKYAAKAAVHIAKHAPVILENPLILVDALPVAVAVGAVVLVAEALDQ